MYGLEYTFTMGVVSLPTVKNGSEGGSNNSTL